MFKVTQIQKDKNHTSQIQIEDNRRKQYFKLEQKLLKEQFSVQSPQKLKET
jgi:hypothetical protein